MRNLRRILSEIFSEICSEIRPKIHPEIFRAFLAGRKFLPQNFTKFSPSEIQISNRIPNQISPKISQTAFCRLGSHIMSWAEIGKDRQSTGNKIVLFFFSGPLCFLFYLLPVFFCILEMIILRNMLSEECPLEVCYRFLFVTEDFMGIVSFNRTCPNLALGLQYETAVWPCLALVRWLSLRWMALVGHSSLWEHGLFAFSLKQGNTEGVEARKTSRTWYECYGNLFMLFNARSSTPTPVFLSSRDETQTMVGAKLRPKVRPPQTLY